MSTTATYEVRSPKRLQVKFTKGGIQTPELLEDLHLPTVCMNDEAALSLCVCVDPLSACRSSRCWGSGWT